MEKVLQYLDDLDDLVGALGLITEKIRNLAWLAAFVLSAAVTTYGAVLLALAEPPLALAMAMMLFVLLLYRSVTQPVHAVRRST